MLLFNALTQIASQASHIARRPNGPMLMLNDRCKVLTFRTGREYRWVPKYRDLVADDWEVIPVQRLIDETNEFAARAAAAATGEVDSNG
jgi:hypothetical protein